MQQEPKLKIIKQQPKNCLTQAIPILQNTQMPNQPTTNHLHLHGTGRFLGCKPLHSYQPLEVPKRENQGSR